MSDITEFLAPQDPAVAEAISHELQRQRDKIELIASENFASRAVMAAQGSCLTNKYAEGLSWQALLRRLRTRRHRRKSGARTRQAAFRR